MNAFTPHRTNFRTKTMDGLIMYLSIKIKSLFHQHLPFHSSAAEHERSSVQDPSKCWRPERNRREMEEAAWLSETSEVSNYECLFCDGNWRIMLRGRCSVQPCERNKQVMEVVPEPRHTNGLCSTHTHTYTHTLLDAHGHSMSQQLIARVLCRRIIQQWTHFLGERHHKVVWSM